MSGRWSEKQAWEWYETMPWLRGCNFMGSDCANRVDQWQELGFEERLKTADKELELAASIGFNTVRLILQFEVWDEEHDGFMERFERYLATCAKHGISAMIVIGNDCCVPKDEFYVPKHCGPQTYDWGYHGGVKNSPHRKLPQMGFNVLDDPVTREKFWQMTAEIMTKYAHDPRVCIWDLYNEPGNCLRGEVTIPNLKEIFSIGWDIRPDQPLTASSLNPIKCPPVDKLAFELSDITNYHLYGNYDIHIKVLHELKKLGRPIVNSEWLHRIRHCDVKELIPLYFLENVGCYCWGFVAGLYQTYEPWEGIWEMVANGTAPADWDLTRWQHDLMRPNYRPYDPKEIAIIKEYSKMADEEFASNSTTP